MMIWIAVAGGLISFGLCRIASAIRESDSFVHVHQIGRTVVEYERARDENDWKVAIRNHQPGRD